LNEVEYKARFAEPQPTCLKSELKEADTRAGRALAYALDIRKFEIELYWKRATYFWAFIASAFAGYALTYRTSTDHEPWLSLLFSSLGLVFSFGWYLANRGSKFWQNNWERHVDLLEDITLGPLYKVVSIDSMSDNILNSPGQFSVSKINQILSVFVTVVWAILFMRSLFPFDRYKFTLFLITTIFLLLLYRFGKSSNQLTTPGLHEKGAVPK
jgi:hypothetical protein